MLLSSRILARTGTRGATLLGALVLGACASTSDGFVSDNPFGTNGNAPKAGGTDTAAEGAGGASPAGDSNGDAARAIAEADILQMEGTHLYALSQYGGLSVIDIGTQDKLTLLGRYTSSGMPFEMYLRDGTVYAMFTGWGQYICTSDGTSCSWQQSSRIEAIDVSDPAHLTRIGSFNLPGDIADSRIVGDVLYAVTYENGYCWGCQSTPNTTITSLNVQDVANIGVIDRLTYTTPDPNNYGWWKRSIAVNQDRMYVGGINWDGTNNGFSTIQAVDISDPNGHLVKGATVQVKGQIESRWQMDEQNGVLRVISQPGVWNTAEAPAVQTFQVTSSTNIQPIATLDLKLPKPERLRSVRFDGDRAFAITAEQMDPLFTIDLHDAAHPVQAGQLEMPGWVYFMEPRGDRVYALGYEQNNPEGSLAVSLFDVADLAHPTMIKRVHFGGSWSNMAEDQDRIHKAFKVDDANGAIFVPYTGWTYNTVDNGCGSYESGIQLIDFTHDSLTLRGKAASQGAARRAFVHEGRLFGVSDAQVATFDITDRDAPHRTADLALSNNVTKTVVVGNHVARLTDDWWTGAAHIEVVPASDPTRTEPLSTFDLAALDNNDQTWCWGWSFWNAQVFGHDHFVYLVRSSGYYGWYEDGYGTSANGEPTTDIAVLDVADPKAPVLRGRLSLPLAQAYRWYGGVMASGEDVVQAGNTLVFRNVSIPSGTNPSASDAIEKATLEVVDLSDADHPTRRSVSLEDGYGHTALVAESNHVRTSHWSPLPGDSSKVRFYLDTLDVSNPASPALTSVNIPGSLLAYDTPSDHAVTVSYQQVVKTGILIQDCYNQFGYNANFTYDDPNPWASNNQAGTCTALHRTANLVALDDNKASLLDQVTLDDRVSYAQPLLGDDRLFLSAGYAYGCYDCGVTNSDAPQLQIFSGIRAGSLTVQTTPMSNDATYRQPTAVVGQQVVLLSYDAPALSVLDATHLDAIQVTEKAKLNGYVYSVTMMGDQALCALGSWGLQSVDLSN